MQNPNDDMNTLRERLDFIGIDAEARTHLADLTATIRTSIGPALDRFYAKIRVHPQTKRFFSNETHIQSAKQRQERHWDAIARGAFDADYVRGVSTVGKVHARLGLEPRWYIGGYALILEELIGHIVEKRWPSRFGRKGSKRLSDEIAVVAKAALMDMDYAISVYLETLEAERKAAEEAKLEAERQQKAALAAFAMAFRSLKEGNLLARVDSGLPGDFATMAADYNASVAQLETAIGGVVTAISSIRTGLSEINTASNDLAHRTEQQAASLEQTVAALGEVTQAVNETADGAGKAQTVASGARQKAEKGGEVVSRAVAAMGQIEQSSEKINSIISVIDEIAFQTNLLALNAGVEAARAGDAGRGFAVVAQEVRGLAQRSAEAAKEIKTLIATSREQVGTGVELVTASGKSLEEIVTEVSSMAEVISTIAASAREQATSLREVSGAADQMDKVTQQNAAMVEEATAASQTLTNETEELATAMAKFRTSASLSGRSAASASGGSRAARPAFRTTTQMKTTGRGGAAPAVHAETESWEEF
ncbi:MAG TPA: methyl-accepting chemotaxis protein [Aurantimonas sp.]|nr:methyl-accepting chemotaxis protein [Aurantimonas sp.]